MPSPSLVENTAGLLKWSAEASVIENEPIESRSDESPKVETTVDPVLPSEVSSSNDTVTEDSPSNDTLTEENKDDTI